MNEYIKLKSHRPSQQNVATNRTSLRCRLTPSDWPVLHR